ncbi:MAG: glycosyltransferase family 2 protein [Fimbriimonas sp.]
MPRVSVIVVSFNTREKLRRCLAQIEPHHETVVVDNASVDGSPEMVREAFPHVRLIASPSNLGFGRANNLGCDHATGDLVLFLNSDAYADPGAIDRLASVFDDPGVVAAGGRLLNPDGSLQESIAGPLTLGAVFLEQTFLDRLFRRLGYGYWRTEPALREAERTDRPARVPQVMGACLMVRAHDGQPRERFDERYFLYCEDTDLCRRLSRHGEIRYDPTAVFIHDLGSSSAKDPARGVIRYNRGKELFFRIHQGRVAEALCWLLDRMGAGLRLLIWSALSLFKPGARSQVRLFWRVLTDRGPDPAASPRTPE